ncbi:hypothetical protein KNE206_68460 [Kitasatospora sp. NE20-6]
MRAGCGRRLRPVIGGGLRWPAVACGGDCRRRGVRDVDELAGAALSEVSVEGRLSPGVKARG